MTFKTFLKQFQEYLNRFRIVKPVKVDGTSFPDAGSLVTTTHFTREICPEI